MSVRRPPPRFLKPVSTIGTDMLGNKFGQITIRPISLRSKYANKYIVSGGGFKTVVHRGGKAGRDRAVKTAKKHQRILDKRSKKKKRRKR